MKKSLSFLYSYLCIRKVGNLKPIFTLIPIVISLLARSGVSFY